MTGSYDRHRHRHHILPWILVPLLLLAAWHYRGALIRRFPVLQKLSYEAEETLHLPAVTDTAEKVQGVSEGKYAYSCLSDAEKTVYDQIYDCISNRKSNVTLSTVDPDVVSRDFNSVLADYPGLFWINGYNYDIYTRGGAATRLTFTPKYTMTVEEEASYQSQVDSTVTQWLSGISESASDYEKSLYVFNTVIQHCTYNTESANNQNILSVFLNGQSVCQGYADATSYLLQKLGIQSTVVTGQARGQNHAWNLVLLDGSYYYIDTTWGDGYYLDENVNQNESTNYAYLNTTTAHMSKTHTPGQTFTLPDCTALTDNYFVKNGRYVTEYQPETIGSMIRSAWEKGDSGIMFQFSSGDVMDQTKEWLFTEENIGQYVRQSSIRYLDRKDDLVLEIQF